MSSGDASKWMGRASRGCVAALLPWHWDPVPASDTGVWLVFRFVFVVVLSPHCSAWRELRHAKYLMRALRSVVQTSSML